MKTAIAAPVVVGAVVLGCGKENDSGPAYERDLSSFVGEDPFRWRDVVNKNPVKVEPDSFPEFDREYVKSLLEQLKSPTGTVQSRYEALLANTAALQFEDLSRATAFKICESGYYITAAHPFFEEENGKPVFPERSVQVFNFTDGSLITIRRMIDHLSSDLVIFYAPNNKPRKRVEGIQIDPRVLEIGEKLWLFGASPEFFADKTFRIRIGIPFGRNQLLRYGELVEGGYFVEGMKPHGGFSGGPVVDKSGVIVGVESSALGPKDDSSVFRYEGALITSVSRLDNVIDQPIRNIAPRAR